MINVSVTLTGRQTKPTNRDASHLKRPHFSDIALFQNSLYISILSPSFSTQLGSKMDNCSKTKLHT